MCFKLYIIVYVVSRLFFVFFKQKTAYEMRISDWSSDVCSSDLEILADSSAASKRWLDPYTYVKGQRMDVEAYFYRDTCTIGLQGHPECKGYDDFTKWSFDLLNQFVIENPDVDLINRYRRIKTDLLKERTAMKEYKTMKESNRWDKHTH